MVEYPNKGQEQFKAEDISARIRIFESSDGRAL